MEIRKLTELVVKNATPGEKDYRLSDGAGLYLVVTKSGGKLWRWSYEFNGKEKLLSYGPYPAVSLSQARELHESAQALKRQGVDPAADKQAKKREQKEIEQKEVEQTSYDADLCSAHKRMAQHLAQKEERQIRANGDHPIGTRYSAGYRGDSH
jgi:Arm domain-containing DNA-binding protein